MLPNTIGLAMDSQVATVFYFSIVRNIISFDDFNGNTKLNYDFAQTKFKPILIKNSIEFERFWLE